MATNTIKQFVESQLITGAVLYEAPAVTVGVIQAANIHNPTAGTVAVQVAITANGVAAGASNIFVDVSITPGKGYPCPELIGQRVSAGHQIKCTGGAGCSIAIGGTEVTGQ